MGKTKRYTPEYFDKYKIHRNWVNRYSKDVKQDFKRHRKKLKNVDVVDGSHLNKLSSDPWFYD